MAEIIIHAGMPKTGSTSLQRWLADNAERLRTRHGIHVLVAANHTPRNPTPRVQVEPYESGDVNSGLVMRAWGLSRFSPTVPLRFVTEVGDLAERFGRVLLTAEGLSRFFNSTDEHVLAGFQDLARAHTVRVAYYVRPQHTAIEAMWREQGFVESVSPHQAVLDRLAPLHHLRTLAVVESHAPDLDFRICPFRPDLMLRSNVIDDFASRFLAIDEECPPLRRNPALPLRFVNALRCAPDGLFRSGTREIYPRAKLRKVAARLDLPSTPELRRSRRILARFCRETFEGENQELIRKLAWRTNAFIPEVKLDAPWDISELDRLWAPTESPEHLADFYRDLDVALRSA